VSWEVRVICDGRLALSNCRLIMVDPHSNAPTTPKIISSVTTYSIMAVSLRRIRVFMMLHNRWRSVRLSRSSAIETSGKSLGIYSSLMRNFDRESRPAGVALAARIICSMSGKFPSSGAGSVTGGWKGSMASSESPSSI
jgi:hypothetical protein